MKNKVIRFLNAGSVFILRFRLFIKKDVIIIDKEMEYTGKLKKANA